MGQPNALAYLALFLWVPLSLFVFQRYKPTVACALLLLGGIMFLPVGLDFDLPALPSFDKQSITTLWAFIGCAVFASNWLRSARFGRSIDWLLVLLFASAAVTTMTNGNPLQYGPLEIPGMSLYDLIGWVLRSVLVLGLPFVLGRAIYRNTDALQTFLRILAGAGLVYSLFALVEVRMSPQISRWIYGFSPFSWVQVLRGGGYRPVVFMTHGLELGLFMATVTMAATILARSGIPVIGRMRKLPPIYLFVVLALCKSTAAFIYALIAVPLIAFTKPRTQMVAATIVAGIVFAYPLLRLADLFPTQQIVDEFKDFSTERAASLEFRFDNEEKLLKRAREHLWFGWGTYGRNRIYNQDGEDTVIVDGAWIIEFGERGLVGFFAVFGILVGPVFWASRRMRWLKRERDRRLLAGLSLIVAFNAADLLPNGLFCYFALLYAGVLAGVVQHARSWNRAESPAVYRAARQKASTSP